MGIEMGNEEANHHPCFNHRISLWDLMSGWWKVRSDCTIFLQALTLSRVRTMPHCFSHNKFRD